jgi:prevent-host-death family protein
MTEATVRDLRNNGAQVLARVAAGESIVITRDGRPVAQLSPLARPRLSAEVLIERFRKLPPMDPARLRKDIDSVIDQSL